MNLIRVQLVSHASLLYMILLEMTHFSKLKSKDQVVQDVFSLEREFCLI